MSFNITFFNVPGDVKNVDLSSNITFFNIPGNVKNVDTPFHSPNYYQPS